MSQRKSDEDEAQRWKDKFLDALEEQEQQEKLLLARIRLLRRGLLGVSLAGDGHDPHLDRQLGELRSILRRDERETGLEYLLEQIERSLLRLDNDKQRSHQELHDSLNNALREFRQLPLSSPTRRRLKKFARQADARAEDPQQQVSLMRQFIELVSAAVLELGQPSAHREQPSSFWLRLFTPTPIQEPSADKEPSAHKEPSAGREPSAEEEPSAHKEPSAPSPEQHIQPPPADLSAVLEPAAPADASMETTDVHESAAHIHIEHDAHAGADIDLDTEWEPKHQKEHELVPLEGELVRDGSGLQEPAFSFIAGHVEPLLLRILESITVSDEMAPRAETLRRRVLTGLNWYEFVAALEDVLSILRTSNDEQRADMQHFLAEVTENLLQVQTFLAQFIEQQQATDERESASHAQLQQHLEEMQHVLAAPDTGVDDLKQSVQAQLGVLMDSLQRMQSQRRTPDGALVSEVRQLISRIASLEEESRELRRYLTQQRERAMRDSLTGLANREAYQHRLAALLRDHSLRSSDLKNPELQSSGSRAEDDDRTLCLAVADVDHFKRINDTFGHLAGDKVLKIIAREILTQVRPQDFVARYGGEEFVLLLPDTRPADAEHLLNRMREAVAAIPFHFRERQISITLSVGVVVARSGQSNGAEAESAEGLFERADQALYEAKAQGRNQVYRQR